MGRCAGCGERAPAGARPGSARHETRRLGVSRRRGGEASAPLTGAPAPTRSLLVLIWTCITGEHGVGAISIILGRQPRTVESIRAAEGDSSIFRLS